MSIMDKSIASRIALLLGLFCLVLCAFLISLLQLLKMLSEEADETVNVALPNMAIASYISKESEWAKGILHDSILCRDRFVHLGVVQEIEARRFPENVLESLEALAVEPGVKEKIKNNLDEIERNPCGHEPGRRPTYRQSAKYGTARKAYPYPQRGLAAA